MKNKSFKLGLPYFFRQQIRRKDSLVRLPELAKLEFEPERTEGLIEDILRWADDGGQMLDPGNRTASRNPATARERTNE